MHILNIPSETQQVYMGSGPGGDPGPAVDPVLGDLSASNAHGNANVSLANVHATGVKRYESDTHTH